MIDLRSDTLSLPDEPMLQTISLVGLGDSGRLEPDGRGSDAIINQLEDYASALLKKEGAIFVCSGTMGNSVAILTHCRPGDCILVDQNQHAYKAEQFTMMDRFGQLTPIFYDSDSRGLPRPESIEANIQKHNIRLILLENTLNSYGGAVIPLSLHREIREISQKYSVPIHLDGARLFNASTALDVEAWQIAQYTDSVMFCVSKGLGAPIGSLVCGSSDFIKEARVTQKLLGSSMRQAGIMAAPALYALKNNINRLAEDHKRTERLAAGIRGAKNLHPQDIVESNILMIHTPEGRAKECCELLKEKGLYAGPVSDDKIRLVVYKGIDDAAIDDAIQILKEVDLAL